MIKKGLLKSAPEIRGRLVFAALLSGSVLCWLAKV